MDRPFETGSVQQTGKGPARAWLLSAVRLAYYLLLTLLITYPLIFHLTDRLLGHPEVDVWNHVWGFWWVKTQLLETGRLPLHTNLLYHPDGGALYFIDPLNAILSIPLQIWLGLEAGFNLTMMGELAFAGWMGHLLARRVSRSEGGGYLAGTLVIFSPILRNEFHNGITEVCNLGWLAFALWAAVRCLDRWRWRDGLLAGVALGLAAVSCWYYGLAGGMAVGLLVVLRIRWLPPFQGRFLPGLGRLALWAGVAGAIFLPFYRAFKKTLDAPDALVHRGSEMQVNQGLLLHNATDLLSFVMPGDYFSPDLWALFEHRFLHTTYLGWSALLIGLLALFTRRGWKWWLITVVFAVLALGPYLFVDGDFVRVNGGRLRLPFYLITQAIGMVSLTHPSRLVMVSLLGLAVLVALGLTRLEQWFPSIRHVFAPCLIVTVMCELAIWGPAPFPLPLSKAEPGPCVEYLAKDPRPGAVIDMPALYFRTMRSNRFLYYATRHGRPVPYLLEMEPNEVPMTLRHAKLFLLLSELSQNRSPDVLDMVKRTPLPSLREGFYGNLSHAGVRFVVLHRDYVSQPAGLWPFRWLLDQAAGPPLSTPDGCWIYTVPSREH